MTIKVVYTAEPPFPPTDQHPRARRAQVGDYWVDYLDDLPSIEDVEAALGVDAASVVRRQIQQIELGNPMTPRYERERDIQLFIAVSRLPAELFDPAVPIEAHQAEFDALSPGAQRLVQVEREIRALRAQL